MDYILYFILTISILVFIHELGHYLAARMCKMRTDVFAIGFGKRLFGWNKINGFTIGNLPEEIDMQGHTDYRISMLPLGGYVKIVGMVDESFDNSFADKEPQPHEFRAKPIYQKLFVISAGVLMNLFLTIGIFSGINYFQGKQVVKTTTIGIVDEEMIAYEAGFRTDDKIISINDSAISDWQRIYVSLFMENSGSSKAVKIIRNGADTTINISGDFLAKAAQEPSFLPIGNLRPIIGSVVEDSPANDAGIKVNDIMLRLNNIPLHGTSQVAKIINSNSEVEIPLTILRGSDTVFTSITPGIDGTIGIGYGAKFMGEVEYENYSLFASIQMGFVDIVQYVVVTFEYMTRVISGQLEVGKAFGGPVKIAQIAADSADMGIIPYLKFLAILSLSLAIFNMLPLPVVDGGHFVIILIEGILRREIPIKIKIAIQNAGFILLLMLMAFIIYSDIINL